MTYTKNVTKLILKILSYKAIPSGGGIEAGIKFLSDPELRKKLLADAEKEALAAIALIKTAPDNPYGNDDDAIAGGILERIIQEEAYRRQNAKASLHNRKTR